jgi:hypothetical protein
VSRAAPDALRLRGGGAAPAPSLDSVFHKYFVGLVAAW